MRLTETERVVLGRIVARVDGLVEDLELLGRFLSGEDLCLIETIKGGLRCSRWVLGALAKCDEGGDGLAPSFEYPPGPDPVLNGGGDDADD